MNGFSCGLRRTTVIGRTRVADFAILESWTTGLIKNKFRNTTGIEFVHRTGRAVGPRRRRWVTRTFLKVSFFLEAVTFTPTSMRPLTQARCHCSIGEPTLLGVLGHPVSVSVSIINVTGVQSSTSGSVFRIYPVTAHYTWAIEPKYLIR